MAAFWGFITIVLLAAAWELYGKSRNRPPTCNRCGGTVRSSSQAVSRSENGAPEADRRSKKANGHIGGTSREAAHNQFEQLDDEVTSVTEMNFENARKTILEVIDTG